MEFEPKKRERNAYFSDIDLISAFNLEQMTSNTSSPFACFRSIQLLARLYLLCCWLQPYAVAYQKKKKSLLLHLTM
jgi:hypothetical protein